MGDKKNPEIAAILSDENMTRWVSEKKTRADVQKLTGLPRQTIDRYIKRGNFKFVYSQQWENRNKSNPDRVNNLTIAWV